MAYAPPRVIGQIKGLKDEVIKKLQIVAEKAGKDVKVISGFEQRVQLEGKDVGKPKLSAHNCAIAADVKIEGLNSVQIAELLEYAGFSGVGRYYNKDGTPTRAAHGDLRGLPAAEGTDYAKGTEKKNKWGYRWYGVDTGRRGGPNKTSIIWDYPDSPPHPTPTKAKPAEVKPAPPAEKARPAIKVNRTMLIAAIIAALVIIAVLLAFFLSSSSGTPAGDLVGTWRTSSPVTFHTQTDFNTGTLQDVESEKRDITWIITAGTSDGTLDIEEHYTSSDVSSTGTYTPEFSPNFYVGVINGDRLTVQKGDSIVGEFNFTSSIITGTWDDSTWSAIYTQRTYTASNGLTLTKQ